MKKLSVLLALVLSTSLFGYQEVNNFLKKFEPRMLGDVIDRGGFIVGESVCENNKYTLYLYTTNAEDVRDVVKKVYDDPDTNKICDPDNLVKAVPIDVSNKRDEITRINGCLIYKQKYLRADGSHGVTQIHNLCYSPRNPLYHPEDPGFSSKLDKTFDEHLKIYKENTAKWNKEYAYIDALWDTNSPEQYTITAKEYNQAVNGAMALGPIIDAGLNLYAEVDVEWLTRSLYSLKVGKDASLRLKQIVEYIKLKR